MPAPYIDHVALGRSRILTQYVESPNLIAYIAALQVGMDNIEAAMQQTALQSDIDVAEGVNLDVIGDIVGISRIIPNGLPYTFFGFTDTGPPDAGAYGDEATGGGYRFYEEGEDTASSGVLGDTEYRLLIRAKIVKNHSDGTGESILKGLDFLFVTAGSVVEDTGGMIFRVGIGRWLTGLEIALINNVDILPRPAAVRLAGKVMFDSTRFFGFSDTPGSWTFGEEGLPSIGGQFAEEF